MSNYGRSPAVRRMREEFVSCPGCLRSRDQVYAQRPNAAMEMNQCLTVEHVHARSNGGSNHESNLMVVCHRCNFTRGNQSPWDWNGAQRGVYADGWPVPQQFYGRQGRRNYWLWENRGRALSALLGHGPVTFDEGFTEHLVQEQASA